GWVPRPEVGAARAGGRGGRARRAAAVAAGGRGAGAGRAGAAADQGRRGDGGRPALSRPARRRPRGRPGRGGGGEAGRRALPFPGCRGGWSPAWPGGVGRNLGRVSIPAEVVRREERR